ncbi:MAG: SDR family NAD(P)-dependent oxidoreductase [Thermoplasmatota archaeon]
MTGELHGKVALVTGAGTGIGRETALRFAEAGAHVLVHYSKSEKEAEETARMVADLGPHAHTLRADLTDRAAPARLAEDALAHFGHVDVLVNNAGMVDPTKFPGDDPPFSERIALWDTVIELNLRAPFVLTTFLGEKMRARGSGAIVNVASIAAYIAMTDAPLYSLSKSALVHFTRQAAKKYSPEVRVNAVAPGWTATGFGDGRILTPEFESRLAKQIPMRRFAEPREVAEAIFFLVANASYTTGHTLAVDGGLASGWR